MSVRLAALGVWLALVAMMFVCVNLSSTGKPQEISVDETR